MNGLEGIREWVRGLVMLALLGTCLELLVPAHSFKKYVRMAMGLLVVLAVTRPVAAILGHPVPLEALATMGSTEPAARPLPTLGQIMTEAAAFRQRSQERAQAEAQDRLAAAVREAALSVAGVASAEAAVTLPVPAGSAAPAVGAVTVVVRLGARAGGGGAGTRIAPVEPVPGAGAARASGAQTKAAPAALADEVRRAVADRLGIAADPGRIQVYVPAPGAGLKGR